MIDSIKLRFGFLVMFIFRRSFISVREILNFFISHCANALVYVVLNKCAHSVVKIKPNSVRCNLFSKVLDFQRKYR